MRRSGITPVGLWWSAGVRAADEPSEVWTATRALRGALRGALREQRALWPPGGALLRRACVDFLSRVHARGGMTFLRNSLDFSPACVFGEFEYLLLEG